MTLLFQPVMKIFSCAFEKEVYSVILTFTFMSIMNLTQKMYHVFDIIVHDAVLFFKCSLLEYENITGFVYRPCIL